MIQQRPAADNDIPPRFDPVAFVLGWALPGLGHWMIGQRRRGTLLAVSLIALILIGPLIGGVCVVDHQRERLWFLPQALGGPLVLLIDQANQRLLKTGRVGEIIEWDREGDRLNPPVNSLESIGWNRDIGILFVALAGLMNLAAMLDAATRPIDSDINVRERRLEER